MWLDKNKSMRRFMIGQHRKSAGIKHVKLIVAATLILLSIFVIWIVVSKQQQKDTISSSESAGQYEAQSIDIGSLSSSGDASLLTSQSLSINGQLRANNSLILTPTNRPGSATTGQLYYDAETNTPYLYDGEEYQALLTGQAIRSIGGANGNITLGTGILLSNNQLSIDGNLLAVVSQAANNIAGVQSIQGRGGDVAFTAGNGIEISGTTITNNGVVSITAASPQLSVAQSTPGVYSVGVVGNFASANGTAGSIALFDSSNNLVNSLLTQIGTVLNASGDIEVAGQIKADTIASFTPSSDLNISAGSSNLVFTSGGRTFQLPSLGAANQTICTVGMDCTVGGGAVYIQLQPSTIQQDMGMGASIAINNTGGGDLLHLQGNSVDALVVHNNGDVTLSGDLIVNGAINGATVNNANINGGTITGANINNASITGGSLTDTSVNGLTIMSTMVAADGALNISTGSNQNLNLNTDGTGIITLGTSEVQGTGALTIAAGGTNQNLTLKGSGTGSVVIETPVFHNANGATYSFDTADLAATNAVICTSIGNCLGSGSSVGGSGDAGTIAVWTGTGFTLGNSLLSQYTDTVTVAGDLAADNLQGNGAGLTNVNAALFDGQTSSYYLNASNINAGTLADVQLSDNVAKYNDTIANFTGTLQQNGVDVCTTAGNCAGTGAGVGGSGTVGTIAIWNGSGFSLGNSALVQDGIGNVTSTQGITAGSFTGNGVALTNVNAITLNGQLPAYYLNASNINSGTLSDLRLSGNVAKYSDVLAAFGGAGSFVGTVSGADAVGSSDFVTLDQLNTTVGGVGGGVASLNSLDSDLIIQGTTGQITISDNGTDTLTLALDSAVTLQGNTFNGANQLVKLDASGLLPAVDGSLLTNVNAVLLQGYNSAYYLDLANATGILDTARIADASLTNVKLQNNSLIVAAGNGLVNGGSVGLGGSTTLNVGAGEGISVTADAIAVDSTVCRTSGNCLGSGGAVSGSGTTGTLALWNGTYTLAASSLTVDSSGNVTVAGDVTADNFDGNGSALTNLDAASVTSGVLSDSRLSSNVTLQGNIINAANGLVQLNATGQLPVVDGSLLTNLNASSLASGTVADVRLSSNVALLNVPANFTNTLSVSGAQVCTTAGNCVGGGGGGVGSGTNGTIAVWASGGTTLGDSLLSQDTGDIVLGGSSTVKSGVTNQALTLQGNGTGGVTVVVPTFENANGASYTFASDASGNYTVCTTAGNCLGSGGAVGGSGTAGKIALWNGSGFTLTDSALTQSDGNLSTTGNITATGDVSATNLQGNGSAVTNVNAAQLGGNAASYYTNASNISSGTLADGRLSTNVTLMGNTFNGINQLVKLDATAKLPVLDGSNLTNVNAVTLGGNASSYYTNASNISSGTLSDSRLSGNVALFDSATANFTGTLQQSGNNVCTTAGNCIGSGGGVGTSGTTTNGTIAVFSPDGYHITNSLLSQSGSTVTITGDLAATNLQGNGSGITSLNASNINAGTLADARLSANVTLAGNTFNIANNLVKLNVTGQLPALDGSLLTSLNGSAISTGTVPDARLSGNVALLNTAANFTGASLQYNGNDVCTTSGNCIGSGGGGVGSGTLNTLALFTPDGNHIGDSMVSQNAAGTILTVSGNLTATAGASVTGNSTVVGTLTGLTGLTSSGTITFSGLSTGVVHSNASGVLSSSLVVNADLQGGTYGAITGTGALTSGSIASGFGTISTTNAITTTGTVTGGMVNATGAGGIQTNGTTIITSGGALQNVTGYTQVSGNMNIGSGNFTQSGSGTITTGTGAVTLNGATTANSSLTIVGAVTLQNTATINGNTTLNGSQLTNAGSTLNLAGTALGNFPSGGSIGTAATTVDVKTSIAINQTTGGQAVTLPSPTDARAGRVVYVFNTGTVPLTVAGITIPNGYGQLYLWNGTTWILGASGGGAAISLQGAYDGGNALTTSDGRDINFTLSNTTTDANFKINVATGSTSLVKIQSNGTDKITFDAPNGKMNIYQDGAMGGVSIGAISDTQIYRSGANRLQMNNALTLRNTTDTATAFDIQNATGTSVLTVDTANKALNVGAAITYNMYTYSAGSGYTTPLAYPVGAAPGSTVSADFNKDGYADVAVSHSTTTSILLSNGDGTFQTAVSYGSTGSNGYDLIAADFNNDSWPDIAYVGIAIAGVLLNNGNGTFTSAVTYTTPASQGNNSTTNTSIDTGDLDGDGDPDLIVGIADYGGTNIKNIARLLNNGDGTFSSVALGAIASGGSSNAPIDVKLGDFNNDGKLDIASIVQRTSSGSTLSISLGSGTGTFANPITTTISANSSYTTYTQVEIDDYDKDGNLDAFVRVPSGWSGPYVDGVAVFRGSGNGTFESEVLYQWGINDATNQTMVGTSLALADVNGDTFIDIITERSGTSYSTAHYLVVALNNGTGGFGAWTNYSVTQNMRGIAAGDFNGDSKPDIAVADTGGPSVYILIRDGTLSATAVPATTSITASSATRTALSLQAAAGQSVDVMQIQTSDAAPLFTVAANGNIGIGNYASLSSSDAKLNVAGNARVAGNIITSGWVSANKLYSDSYEVCNASANSLCIRNSNSTQNGNINLTGQGQFGTSLSVRTNTNISTAFRVQDAAGTNVLAVDTTTKSVSIGAPLSYNSLSYTNGFGFMPKLDYGTGTNPVRVVAADVNNDGIQDMVVANSGSSDMYIRIGVGDGTFGVPATISTMSYLTDVAVADLNSDGYKDIVVSGNSSPNNVRVYLNNGSSGYSAYATYAAGAVYVKSIAISDLNEDGYLDIAAISNGSSNGSNSTTYLSTFLNNGSGAFASAQNFVPASDPTYTMQRSLVIGDFNGDGKQDVVSARTSGTVGAILFPGNGDGTFGSSMSITTTESNQVSFAVADLNADSKLDLVFGPSTIGRPLIVMLGNGDGTFQAGIQLTQPYPTTGLAIADLNSDGKLDILSHDYQSGNLLVRLGNGNGTFQAYTTYTNTSTNQYVYGYAIADLNSDGLLDIMAANYSAASVSIFINGTVVTGTTVNASLGAQATSATNSALVLQGANGQSVDILHVQDSNQNMYFGISQSGKVGVGSWANSVLDNSSYLLNVAGAAQFQGTIYSNAPNFYANDLMDLRINNVSKFRVTNTGDTTIGGTVTVVGAASFAGTVIVTGATSVQTITVNRHIISGGSMPTIAAGTAACTAPTVSVAGTDTAGMITVTTGTGCSGTGALATVTFNTAFGAAPRVSLTAATSGSAALVTYVDSGIISTTAFSIGTNTQPADSTTYKWYYQVIQ